LLASHLFLLSRTYGIFNTFLAMGSPRPWLGRGSRTFLVEIACSLPFAVTSFSVIIVFCCLFYVWPSVTPDDPDPRRAGPQILAVFSDGQAREASPFFFS